MTLFRWEEVHPPYNLFEYNSHAQSHRASYNNKPFKGTVSVISSDPLCTHGNARFRTVPFKALPVQVWLRYPCFCFFKLFISVSDFSAKVACAMYIKNVHQGYRIKSCIAIFAWMVTWNYAYSPFYGTVHDNKRGLKDLSLLNTITYIL